MWWKGLKEVQEVHSLRDLLGKRKSIKWWSKKKWFAQDVPKQFNIFQVDSWSNWCTKRGTDKWRCSILSTHVVAYWWANEHIRFNNLWTIYGKNWQKQMNVIHTLQWITALHEEPGWNSRLDFPVCRYWVCSHGQCVDCTPYPRNTLTPQRIYLQLLKSSNAGI